MKTELKKAGCPSKKISFEEILRIIRKAKVDDKAYSRLLKDFDEVLKNSSSWRNSLLVFPCKQSIKVVETYGVHVWTYGETPREKAKYFAPHLNKEIGCVFEIDCVVRVRDGGEKIKRISSPTGISEDEIERRVDSFLKNSGRIKDFQSNDNVKEHGMILFILTKESRAGTCVTEVNLGRSNTYLRNIAKGLDNSRDLAKRMDGKTFDKLKKLDDEYALTT